MVFCCVFHHFEAISFHLLQQEKGLPVAPLSPLNSAAFLERRDAILRSKCRVVRPEDWLQLPGNYCYLTWYHELCRD